MCSFPLSQQEAHRIGDDFLQLEKFVNLNYMVSRARRKGHGCKLTRMQAIAATAAYGYSPGGHHGNDRSANWPVTRTSCCTLTHQALIQLQQLSYSKQERRTGRLGLIGAMGVSTRCVSLLYAFVP